MPDAGAAPSKVCVVCGINVADKPRVKDAAGRYMCKACAEKQTAAKPSTGAAGGKSGGASTKPAAKPGSGDKGPIPMAAAAGSGNYDPVMAALVESSAQATSSACPNCKGWVREGQLLCTSCGFNLQEGKQVRTRVQREKAPKEARSSGAGGKPRWYVGEKANYGPLIIGGGMFVLNALSMGVASTDPEKYVGLMLFNSICGLVLFVAVLIQAYQAGLGTFLAVLLTQCIPIVGLLVYVHFLLTKCESPTVKWAGLGALFGSVIGLVILYGTNPDILTEGIGRPRNAIIQVQ